MFLNQRLMHQLATSRSVLSEAILVLVAQENRIASLSLGAIGVSRGDKIIAHLGLGIESDLGPNLKTLLEFHLYTVTLEYSEIHSIILVNLPSIYSHFFLDNYTETYLGTFICRRTFLDSVEQDAYRRYSKED